MTEDSDLFIFGAKKLIVKALAKIIEFIYWMYNIYWVYLTFPTVSKFV